MADPTEAGTRSRGDEAVRLVGKAGGYIAGLSSVVAYAIWGIGAALFVLGVQIIATAAGWSTCWFNNVDATSPAPESGRTPPV